MPDASIIPVPKELPELGPEWVKAADLAAHNLGFVSLLSALCPEHWQIVLSSVSNRMHLQGVPLPLGWQQALAKQVGRHEARPQGKTLILAFWKKQTNADGPPVP